MNQSDIHLVDLPNELLIIILKKLDNIDVLYSLFGINNKRLETLVEDDVFTNILNFVRKSFITDVKLDRFCTSLLPQNYYSIKKFILETTYMERILLAGDCPNLTHLELFNFEQEIIFRYFTYDLPFRHIFKHQITDLILYNNDEYASETSVKTYNTKVYSHILDLFQNLQHLTIVASSTDEYPPLSRCRLPSNIYFSSTLTVLYINVFGIDDCFSLLDGRLKQLTTFIVQIHYISDSQVIPRDMNEPPTLKCFSLTCHSVIYRYDELVVSLFRRLTHLEKLTLYLRIRNRSTFVDGAHLYNEILVHMPQLHTFIFYISTENKINEPVHRISNDDIHPTFTYLKYGQTSCIVDYFNTYKAICHVFSLPFTFTHLEKLSNGFPPIVFDYVTYLYAYDMVPFKHEFFLRISRAFPLLQCFSMMNNTPQSWNSDELKSDETSPDSVIEYPHFTSLDIMRVDIDYVVQFLLETKAYLPRLTELQVSYNQLKTVTMNFTRNVTRRSCSKVKRLIVEESTVLSKDVYRYFPSL